MMPDQQPVPDGPRRRWMTLALPAVVTCAALAATLSGAQETGPAARPSPAASSRALDVIDVQPTPDAPIPLRVWARQDLPDNFADDVAELPNVTGVLRSQQDIVRVAGARDVDGRPVPGPGSGLVVPMQATTVDVRDEELPFALGSLEAGEVALSETAAGRRGVGPGGSLEVNGHRFDVAVIVPDEIAGSSEILISNEAAAALELRRLVLVVHHEGDPDVLEEQIEALLPSEVDIRVRQLREGEDRRPRTRSLVDMKERFGEFAHGPVASDGRFQQDAAWREQNIVTARVPILGAITCHREFLPLVAGALGEVEEAGLGHLVDPSDYAGCWASRLIGGSTSISKHAWGAAIDINASANRDGDQPSIDSRVVAIFERWGMRWGGDFPTPDGMHFEWSFDPSP